jgi:hypothetical protein
MLKKGTRVRLVIMFFTAIILLSLITESLNLGLITSASGLSSKPVEQGKSATDTPSCGYGAIGSSVQDVLSMALTENVAIQQNGHTETALIIDMPPSALADAYRRSLGVASDLPLGQEVPIPDNITMSRNDNNGGKAMGIMIPVKPRFYESIEHQQETSLGVITRIFASSVMPTNNNNGCTVSINATGLLPMSAALQPNSNYECAVAVRPTSPNAIAGSIFSSLEMAQMMLKSLPGENSYECLWVTRISLPLGSTLLNTQEISGLEWKIEFGGGTCITASVAVEDASTIVLKEKTVVTERPVLAAPHYLYDAFSLYKTFIIKYQLSRPASSSLAEYNNELNLSGWSGDTWSDTWTTTWSDTQSATFTYGPLSAELAATASLSLTVYVGWDFDLFQGLTSFESWMSFGASVHVDFQASASASYSKEWEESLFEWTTEYSFFVGVVPVWADLEINATGVLSVNAYGQFALNAGGIASGSFKAGVRWTSSQGWSGIFEVSTSASHTAPNFQAQAGVYIRPSIPFRISFLFYGVAGPFIEFEPYAQATITCTYPPPHGDWEITVNLQITAGATFAGWLKDLLGLDDWSVLLYDAQLMKWSGSWGASIISITETLNPSTVLTNGSVQAYGTATLNDGSTVSLTDVIITVVQTGARWVTTTDNNGFYSAYISAPPSGGSYTVRAEIATGTVSGSASQPLIVQDTSGGSQYSFYRSTTCKGIQESYPYDPIDETETFRASDAVAWTWVQLTYVYRSLNVKWEWYEPDGSYYASSTCVVPDPTSQGYAYWEWFKCSGGINVKDNAPQDIPGRWTSKIYIDEGSGYQLKAIENFVIRYAITRRTMAKDVQTSLPYEPVNPTNQFLNTDPKALGWIGLDDVAEQLEVKWEYYDPSNSLYSTFLYTVPDPSTQGYSYWDWYVFWGYINIYGFQPQSELGLWTVKSYIKDVYGNWLLEYSEYFMIADNTPPSAPGTPSDGGDYSTTGTLTWSFIAAQEDGTLANYYEIQIGTMPGGNNVFDGYVDRPMRARVLGATLQDLPSGATYYARARAMNTVGQWGPWSGNSDGIIVDRPPVTIMVEGPSETINCRDALFAWKGTDDVTPAANLVYSYYLQGKDADWSTWQSTTSVQYSNLPNGNYQFQVKAKDQHGSEDPTPANTSFTVDAYVCPMWVDPANVLLSSLDVSVGQRFNVTVWINITGSVYAYQIGLHYNRTQLQCTSSAFTDGTTSSYFAGHTTVSAGPTIDTSALGNGTVLAGESLLGSDFIPGPKSASLIWVEFQILIIPSNRNFTSKFDISTEYSSNTYVLDPDLDNVDITTYDGNYQLIYSVGVHDVAVADVISYKTVIGRGDSLNISVTVADRGNSIETFNLTAYANTTIIATQNITLPSGNSTTVMFSWNTTAFAKGNYTISAYSLPVPGETSTADNNLTGGWVFVSMVGDLTGPIPFVPDGKVDIRDIAVVAKAFGSAPGMPLWNVNCDITGPTPGVPDGKVDIRDIAVVAKHFGESSL